MNRSAKEIADELHVGKQKVYRFIVKNNLQEDAEPGPRGVKLYDESVQALIRAEFAQPEREAVEAVGDAVNDTVETVRDAVSRANGVVHEAVVEAVRANETVDDAVDEAVTKTDEAVSDAVIELLRKELEAKNEQIASLQRQNSQLTEALQGAMQSLQAAQMLHAESVRQIEAGNTPQEQKESVVVPPAPEPSQKKGFWARIFGR